jgi:meso-butanediol dehydrogenase / (S,S)-butanediol dehydrogenase / diacetyl reductase
MAKTIVITGAGDGLGRALARRFARDGDNVILLGRTLSKVQAVADELGARHKAIACDVTQPESVRAAFAEIAASHDRIDVLVNNAAIYEPFGVHEVRDDQLFSQLHTNLAGPILCLREAYALLKGGGHVINVSSESCSIKMPMLWLYAGTKQALELASEMWNHELKPDRIRVTVIRAGQMYDETKTGTSWDPEVAMRFHQANMAIGVNLRERGATHYDNVTGVFRAVIDTPPDLHIGLVTLTARPRG